MPLTALIDGDPLIYKAAIACETATKWDDDVWSVAANESEARSIIDTELTRIREELRATAVIVALSDSANFRKAILPTYKGNRKDVRKPLLLKPLRDYITNVYSVFVRPALEADDILGILGTHPTLVRGARVVVSIDKDLQSVPGETYNPDTGLRKLITEEEADRFHLMQTLTGDRVDGYAGCPGCGPKKAAKYLSTGATWANVVKAYRWANLEEADALVQARVARILRHTDYDYENKRPILWTPKGIEE